jgi:hypothetical protein
MAVGFVARRHDNRTCVWNSLYRLLQQPKFERIGLRLPASIAGGAGARPDHSISGICAGQQIGIFLFLVSSAATKLSSSRICIGASDA